jgi:hypothetical protein
MNDVFRLYKECTGETLDLAKEAEAQEKTRRAAGCPVDADGNIIGFNKIIYILNIQIEYYYCCYCLIQKVLILQVLLLLLQAQVRKQLRPYHHHRRAILLLLQLNHPPNLLLQLSLLLFLRKKI